MLSRSTIPGFLVNSWGRVVPCALFFNVIGIALWPYDFFASFGEHLSIGRLIEGCTVAGIACGIGIAWMQAVCEADSWVWFRGRISEHSLEKAVPLEPGKNDAGWRLVSAASTKALPR